MLHRLNALNTSTRISARNHNYNHILIIQTAAISYQTVQWTKNQDRVKDYQLLSFRPLNYTYALKALTVNDTTRATAAFRQLQKGHALIYAGGDFNNAKQLLNAVARRCSGASSSQRRKRQENREERDLKISTRQQWIEQKKLQGEQSDITNRILIQISLDDNSRPSQIIEMKRIPKNVKEVLNFAFQNNQALNLSKGDTSCNCILLPLNEFLAMIGGYEWNKKGVYIHALKGHIHPHFGVFPPTRQDYIPLLNNINIDKTERKYIRMMEVGIGSGVLSIILLKQKKVDYIIGTDINPYAIACANENIKIFGFEDNINLMQTDLFPPKTDGDVNDKVDAVLFNAPWIPGIASTWLDQAVYDTKQDLLRRFLAQVRHYVNNDGHIYLLLSNIGILLNLFQEKDLYAMFEAGNLELINVYKTKSKDRASKNVNNSNIKSKKIQDHSPSIANARYKEVIALYHLRPKR